MIRNIKDNNIKLIGSCDDSPSSGLLSMTILKSLLIPARSVSVGIGNLNDSMIIRALLRKGTTFNSSYNVVIYWNSSVSLVGAVQVATLDVPGTWSAPYIYRHVKADNDILGAHKLKTFSSTTSLMTDIGDDANAISTLDVDFSVDSYFIVAAKRISISKSFDSIVCSYLTVEL